MPIRPSSMAADRPAGPPPMTSTSVSVSGMSWRSGAASAAGSSGRPSQLATIMLSVTGVMHDLTGMPLAMTMHLEHWPLAQNRPWPVPSRWCRPNTLTPLAMSAELIISPRRALSG